MSYSNLPATYESVAKCTISQAVGCAKRLDKAFALGIPENEADQVTVYEEEMINLFQEYTHPEVCAAVAHAIRHFKKRPTIAHMAELLRNDRRERVRHEEVIKRYTMPPPVVPVWQPKEPIQTPGEKESFVNEVLKKYGLHAEVMAHREREALQKWHPAPGSVPRNFRQLG